MYVQFIHVHVRTGTSTIAHQPPPTNSQDLLLKNISWVGRFPGTIPKVGNFFLQFWLIMALVQFWLHVIWNRKNGPFPQYFTSKWNSPFQKITSILAECQRNRLLYPVNDVQGVVISWSRELGGLSRRCQANFEQIPNAFSGSARSADIF